MSGEILFTCKAPGDREIQVVRGDLTKEEVDAIVNAANEHLAHGGGVAGAIVRRGGWQIQEESNRWVSEHGPVPTGSAAITRAGALPAKYVIHAVGPVWGSGDEVHKLSSAIASALSIACDKNMSSIAFPAISSGIFGFPKDLCAKVFFDTIFQYFEDHPDCSLRLVRLTNIDRLTAEIFLKEAQSRCGESQG